VEHDGQRYELHPLDARLNGTTGRLPLREPQASGVPFDPNDPLLLG
jgi:hypothetical protein